MSPLPSIRRHRSAAPGIAVVLKGYPRLSETFIAQEIKALQDLGIDLRLFSLRQPTDPTIHPIHREIHAPVTYLPEYIYREPVRAIGGLCHALVRRRAGRALRAWLRDLARDPTPNRVRRFVQAAVMAREFPPDCRAVYAHFMHTPGSVARYASMLLGLPWAVSAHAKDIWTLSDWEKREKLADCAFAVTCTEFNAAHLKSLAPDPARVHRLYHGIDLARFPDPGTRGETANGSAAHPVTILSVGRAVPKKGYPLLLRALASLPANLHWRFRHVGGGPELDGLKQEAAELGIAERIDWLGALSQQEVLDAYRRADLFVLSSTVTGDGDRDGLPNVLMEAQSQRLCCIATRVSAIPEILIDGETGVITAPDDAQALADAMAALIADPARRERLAESALARLRENFESQRQIGLLKRLLEDL